MKYLISLAALFLVGCACNEKLPDLDIPITSGFYEDAAEFANEVARTNELSRWISIGGAAGAFIGFLAFVFVPVWITPKWVSAASIPMSVLMAVFAHRLIEWLGSDWAGYIFGVSIGFVVINALAYFAYKLWCNTKNRLLSVKRMVD